MKNRFFIVPTTTLFLAILFSSLLYSLSFASPEKIKIGIALPLTGEAQAYGEDMRDVLTFASQKLDPGRFELIFQDAKCSAQDALTATQRLIERDKVEFILGYLCSSGALVAAPVATKAKIPIIVTGASSPRISKSGEYIFRTAPNDSIASKTLHDFIAKNKVENQIIGIISTESDYAQDFKEAFLQYEKEKPAFQSTITEDYLPGIPDFKTILTKLKLKGVTTLFINPQMDSDLTVMLKQLSELNWKPQLYAAYYPGNTEVLKNYAKFMEGIIYVDAKDNSKFLNQNGEAIYEEFKSKYKIRGIETVFPSNFEAFRVMDQAFNNRDTSASENDQKEKKDILNYISKTTFDGVFGKYNFDQDGEIVGQQFSIKSIKGGKIEIIE